MPGAPASLPILEAPLPVSVILVFVIVSLWLATGRLLLRTGSPEKPKAADLALLLAHGLVFTSSLAATVLLGRLSCFALPPLIQLGLLAWNLRRPARPSTEGPGATDPASRRASPLATIATIAAVALLTCWDNALVIAGKLAPLNADLGYFALLAKGLPEAGVASFWAAALGPLTQAAGETQDLWYHWGSLWLVAAVARCTSLPELSCLLHIIDPALNASLVLASASVIQSLTRWSWHRCLLAGLASILAVSWPSLTGLGSLASLISGDLRQHVHPALYGMFSYKFEAVLVFGALSAWLHQRRSQAAWLLAFAALSAPHVFAVGGLAGGMLGLFALAARSVPRIHLATVIIVLLLSSWAVLHFGFGVSLPKTAETRFFNPAPAALLTGTGQAVKDTLLGVLLALPLLPGLRKLKHLRQPDTCPAAMAEATGDWARLALGSLVGSYFAYALLLPEGDRAHFTMVAHAFLVFPVAFWGLCAGASHGSAITRRFFLALLLLTTSFGVVDRLSSRSWAANGRHDAAPLQQAAALLQGQPWGYFASSDRNWWISQHAILAGALNARCIRLNLIPSRDTTTDAARFYGSSRPLDLNPRLASDSDAAWALRLATHLGIKYLLVPEPNAVPTDFLSQTQEILRSTTWSLHRLPETRNP